jgi:hypothetical protein
MGDFLFDEMKKLYPDLPDDQVVAKIESVDQGSQAQASPEMIQPVTPPNSGPLTNIQGPETPIVAPADPYKDMAIENVRQKYLGDKYSAAERQKIVDENKADASGPNFRAALASLGAGFAGRDPTSAANSIINEQAHQRSEKLSNFDEAKKSQLEDLKSGQDLTKFGQDQDKLKREMDPNSPESKLAQELAVQMGMNPEQAKGLTAAKFKDFSPIMEKKFAAAEAAQARKDVAETNAQARRDALEMKKLDRADNIQDKALTSTQQLLESARGNPAAAQAERDLYAADKAKSLANMYGDPNKLSQRQVSLLVSEIGKIAQGGAPTMSELEGLSPDTLRGKLSRFWEKLSNSPTAANAAEFVKQYTDYASVLSKDAQKVINDKYGRVIETRKDQLGPKNYKALQDQYLHRFQNSEASAPGSMNSPDQSQMKTVGGKLYLKVKLLF